MKFFVSLFVLRIIPRYLICNFYEIFVFEVEKRKKKKKKKEKDFVDLLSLYIEKLHVRIRSFAKHNGKA